MPKLFIYFHGISSFVCTSFFVVPLCILQKKIGQSNFYFSSETLALLSRDFLLFLKLWRRVESTLQKNKKTSDMSKVIKRLLLFLYFSWIHSFDSFILTYVYEEVWSRIVAAVMGMEIETIFLFLIHIHWFMRINMVYLLWWACNLSW